LWIVVAALSLQLGLRSVNVYAQDARAQATVSDDSRFALEAILARLRTEDRDARSQAVDALNALEESDVPAIRQRLLSNLGMSHFNVHAAMVRAIRLVTGGRENAEYDLLTALINYPTRTPDVDVATERVALARALGNIKCAESGRALIAFGLAHNKIFRLATIRIAKNQLREYICPAVIEFRRPTEDARLYLRQVREAARRVTPGECVQTRDNALLAEVLRAFGSVRQTDAMAVVANYVNSDRVQVRDAARWAIAQYGRDAINTLRNTYENFVGEDTNPLWGWERIARELYAAYDRRKAEDVQATLDAGLAAASAGRMQEMLEKFEWVLARHPLYERRSEMVAPLVRYAQSLEASDSAKATVIYRTALRLAPDGPQAPQIRAAILFLEAERALARGVADPELYRAAIVQDANHLRARAQYEAVAQDELIKRRHRRRAIGAVGLLVVALAAIALIATEPKRSKRKKERQNQPVESESSVAPAVESKLSEAAEALGSQGESSVELKQSTASEQAAPEPTASDQSGDSTAPSPLTPSGEVLDSADTKSLQSDTQSAARESSASGDQIAVVDGAASTDAGESRDES
jgi:hypothetical protein